MKSITITPKDITITPKDITKYGLNFSSSEQVIDELAYCAGQSTSEELYDYMEYPQEPYDYDYEKDLFAATKTSDELYSIAKKLDFSLNANWERLSKEQNLQAGACVALNNSGEWNALLFVYTEALKSGGTESMSVAFNKALQDEIDSYQKDDYKTWLYGDRDFVGVVRGISRYFTNSRECEYNDKKDEYIFVLDEQDIQDAKDAGYKVSQLKKWLLDSIIAAGNKRAQKESEERAKRKAEHERVTAYKKERAEKEAEERKAKLLSMKLN